MEKIIRNKIIIIPTSILLIAGISYWWLTSSEIQNIPALIELETNYINNESLNPVEIKGRCSHNGLSIKLKGAIYLATNCENNTWSIPFDHSTVPDGNYEFTAEYSGLFAPEILQVFKINKDTASPQKPGPMLLTPNGILTWTSAENQDQDFIEYEISVGDASGKTNLLDWKKNGPENTFSIPQNLLQEKNLYPQIRSLDISGNKSDSQQEMLATPTPIPTLLPTSTAPPKKSTFSVLNWLNTNCSTPATPKSTQLCQKENLLSIIPRKISAAKNPLVKGDHADEILILKNTAGDKALFFDSMRMNTDSYDHLRTSNCQTFFVSSKNGEEFFNVYNHHTDIFKEFSSAELQNPKIKSSLCSNYKNPPEIKEPKSKKLPKHKNAPKESSLFNKKVKITPKKGKHPEKNIEIMDYEITLFVSEKSKRFVLQPEYNKSHTNSIPLYVQLPNQWTVSTNFGATNTETKYLFEKTLGLFVNNNSKISFSKHSERFALAEQEKPNGPVKLTIYELKPKKLLTPLISPNLQKYFSSYPNQNMQIKNLNFEWLKADKLKMSTKAKKKSFTTQLCQKGGTWMTCK